MIYEVTIAERTYRVELMRSGEQWKCWLDGKSYEVKQETVGAEASVVIDNERFSASVRDPRSFRSRRPAGATEHGVRKITAPMPGKVVRILAGVGAQVEAGQSVIVIEAMKM